NGNLNFRDHSSADQATITNTGSFTRDANVNFRNNATAGHSIIDNYSAGAGGGIGRVTFEDSSTAGDATLRNHQFSLITFKDSSTAGNATITNDEFGTILFEDMASGGNATIINNGGAVQPGIVDISGL